MKLATYRCGDDLRIGSVLDGEKRILDLAGAARADGRDDGIFSNMLDLIDAGPNGLERAADIQDGYGSEVGLTLAIDEIELMAPLPVPRQMRDFTVFPGHIRQAPIGMQKLQARMAGKPAPNLAAPEDINPVYRAQPIYYLTNRFSVAGPNATVVWPSYSHYMDFELELAVVLGRTGQNISAADASNYIFGYTIYNDFSARDTQVIEMQGFLGPAKGKSFDGGNVIGPWIVTPDEIPDPHDLDMSARVNGETWSRGSTKDMLHTFEEMIEFVSRDETLHAGEIFGSGTVGGGCGLELDRYLESGDTVELEIEHVGLLRNIVVQSADETLAVETPRTSRRATM